LLQEADTDVTLVRIRNHKSALLTRHVLMAAAGIGAGPAEFFEVRDEVAALSGA
jgi:hypothetical protein